jgi:DNA-binding transcriptional LysR family regulator
VAVAEELHFGRAAARLHMTQPPLTQAIPGAGAHAGRAAVRAQPPQRALTPAGAALLPQALKLLEDAEALAPLVRAAADGRRGRLRLGFVSTVGYGELPRWLRSFRELEPAVELQLREATWDVQQQAFASGDIDAGFAIHAPGGVPSGFESLRIAAEPMVLALSSEDPLAQQARVPVRAALARPLVMYPREIAPSLFDALLSFYSAHSVAPQITQEAIQMQTIVNLVSAGMGAAWVPEAVMGLQRPGVVYKRIRGAVPLCETSLLWPADAAPAVLRFVAHVRAQLKAAK